jgi:hypothetical protein
MAKRIPLEGRVFGLLTVTEFVGVNEQRQAMYSVVCRCGERRIVRGSDLLTEKTRTCGAGCKRKIQWQLSAIFPNVGCDKLDEKSRVSFTEIRRGETDRTRFSK